MAITYKQAGVDMDAGDKLVARIARIARHAQTPECLGGVGGFAGLCTLPPNLQAPVLVSGADGVGTKLDIARAAGIHDTIGIDLVAMCVNDVVTTGARPLFFLDYFATSELDVDVGETVIRGIAQGCKIAGCALLGGETAEMPGMYAPGTYDLAGFAVGVVERARIVDGTRCKANDAIIALASSGLHSNGFSLVRAVLRNANRSVHDFDARLDANIGQTLLVPTRIYVSSVLTLLETLGFEQVHAICHVTGSGIDGNLPRVLPRGLGAVVDLSTFERPAVFRWLSELGPIEESEMRRTFNIGIGLLLAVSPEAVADALEVLGRSGERAWVVGRLEPLAASPNEPPRVTFCG